MNSTARFPDVFRLALAVVVALVLGSTLTGCSQEGKTVQDQLLVQAIAFDASKVTVGSNSIVGTDSALVDLVIKLQTVYANGCEARGGLELRSEGPLLEPLFVIVPAVRYTADEPCNVGLAGDTLQSITVRNLALDGWSATLIDSIVRFEVRGLGGPPFRFNVNASVASRGDTATVFYVLVEDKETAAPLAGAIVRAERSGTPEVFFEGPTGADGRAVFQVSCSGAAGDVAAPYLIKVSYAGRITIFAVQDPPALCKRRETIIVRV